MADTRTRISTFINRFSPEIAARFRKARTELRAQFVRGYELVYDNYNAFGCGYSTTEKSSGVVVSLVAYPKWITLFFFQGVTLADPDGILQGSGSRIRSVRLGPPELLKSRSVRALLKQAISQHRQEFAGAPRLSTQIKTVVEKRRSRRPAAKAARQRAAP